MISTWSKAKFAEVAPSKPLKVKDVDAEDKIWQLNLNHIESNTGKLIQLDIQPYSKAGNSTHWFDEHHVLYSKLRPYLNKVLLPQQKGLATTELVPMLPNERLLNRKYLAYYLKSKQFVDWVSAQTAGAKMPRVSMKVFWEHKIPLPPLAEQQKIAAILDAADQLRQKDQQLIDHYTSLSQSLFLEMFGDPVTNPMGWKYKTLKELCLKITDGTHHSPPLINSGVPYVTAKHVKSYGLDFFSKPTYVCQDDHEGIYARCAPENGDVLYIKDGATTGIACLNTFNEPISLLSSLALLKTKPASINNHFLCFWLNHSGIKQKLIQQYMSGAAIQRYTLAKIKTFSLVLPPIELQNQFAQHIEKIEQQKQYAQASREQSETLFNSLLQRAFKGELT